MIKIKKQDLKDMIILGYINPNAKDKGFAVTSRSKSSKRKKVYVREDLYNTFNKYI